MTEPRRISFVDKFAIEDILDEREKQLTLEMSYGQTTESHSEKEARLNEVREIRRLMEKRFK